MKYQHLKIDCIVKLQELHVLAKDVNVRLIDLATRPTYIVNQLIGMARIGATLEDFLDEETDFSNICYITHEVKSIYIHYQHF